MTTNSPEYMKRYRELHEDYRLRNRRRVNARQAAALKVAKRYPKEFNAAIAEEMAKR